MLYLIIPVIDFGYFALKWGKTSDFNIFIFSIGYFWTVAQLGPIPPRCNRCYIYEKGGGRKGGADFERVFQKGEEGKGEKGGGVGLVASLEISVAGKGEKGFDFEKV